MKKSMKKNYFYSTYDNFMSVYYVFFLFKELDLTPK